MVSKENIFVSVPQPEQGGLTPRGELISAFPSPLEIVLASESRRIVHESLEEALTEKERQVIKLTYWDGVESIKEIAAIMGITLQAAKQCRYRAIKKLRNYLKLVNYVLD
jgi:RNA polymerase sigma factor (sigma-70 family)